ncbi:MAG: VCBS repeat-containing protein [Planctomycetota bacterium]|nr:VCBS repeat-containing protein [Planctomycetota bacterium]
MDPRFAIPFVCVLATSASAQFGVEWVEFEEDPGLLSVSGPISSVAIEVDFAWGDLDDDGWIDLVVVRKEPFSALGKRTNLLLRNEAGVLTDRTAAYASASDVPGDLGFLTPTADRDAVFTDVDRDGWLDVVTAVDVSPGDPKHIGHPRVYRNLGSGAGWLGLRHEEARIPQLYVFGSGSAVNPLFVSVTAGDVTGNGYPDLYFTDHGSDPLYSPPAGTDLNDRLLINDGNGFFADESQLWMTATMLESEFGAHAIIVDVNQDGVNDIVKNTTQNTPRHISVSYNDPGDEGDFDLFQIAYESSLEPYHFDLGDLNGDGRLDMVVADDTQDRYMYNQGNDALGRVLWGPKRTFAFLAGSDDGFGSNPLIVDLDEDGWNDVVMCDISDGTPTGYVRRIHVYHNPGGAVGAEIILREEREHGGSSAWLGAVGLYHDDLGAGHDVAVFDVDHDGDKELILGRKDGTFAWRNLLDPTVCQPSIGYQGPGDATLSICGDALTPGGSATLRIDSDLAGAAVVLAYGPTLNPTSYAGGTIVPLPPLAVLSFTTDAAGDLTLPISPGAAGHPGGSGPLVLYAQAGVADAAQPGGYQITNALAVELLP